jgi:hypothetical protein
MTFLRFGMKILVSGFARFLGRGNGLGLVDWEVSSPSGSGLFWPTFADVLGWPSAGFS